MISDLNLYGKRLFKCENLFYYYFGAQATRCRLRYFRIGAPTRIAPPKASTKTAEGPTRIAPQTAMGAAIGPSNPMSPVLRNPLTRHRLFPPNGRRPTRASRPQTAEGPTRIAPPKASTKTALGPSNPMSPVLRNPLTRHRLFPPNGRRPTRALRRRRPHAHRAAEGLKKNGRSPTRASRPKPPSAWPSASLFSMPSASPPPDVIILKNFIMILTGHA